MKRILSWLRKHGKDKLLDIFILSMKGPSNERIVNKQ